MPPFAAEYVAGNEQTIPAEHAARWEAAGDVGYDRTPMGKAFPSPSTVIGSDGRPQPADWVLEAAAQLRGEV